jgi:hypothetical protein
MYIVWLVGMLVFLTGTVQAQTTEQLLQQWSAERDRNWQRLHETVQSQQRQAQQQEAESLARSRDAYSRMQGAPNPLYLTPANPTGQCQGVWFGGKYCQVCTMPNGMGQTICN